MRQFRHGDGAQVSRGGKQSAIDMMIKRFGTKEIELQFVGTGAVLDFGAAFAARIVDGDADDEVALGQVGTATQPVRVVGAAGGRFVEAAGVASGARAGTST